MTELVVRRLLIDLEQPFARHWCGGDAFRTAFFNALSMSFPVGEQFFIDAVREGGRKLPADQQERFAAEVRGFVGQEATHRRIHGLFNDHLEKQGLVNSWGPRALQRQKLLAGLDVRHHLGVTAAFEHFTAILAEWMLGHPDILANAEPRLQTLWMWHSAEESEHKSTAFDVYKALGGDEAWRCRWMRRITVFFLADVMRQTVRNLHRDGTLWKFSTWRSGWQYLLGRDGLVRQTYKPWRAYFAKGFHPRQQDSALSEQWLAGHASQFAPVAAK